MKKPFTLDITRNLETIETFTNSCRATSINHDLIYNPKKVEEYLEKYKNYKKIYLSEDDPKKDLRVYIVKDEDTIIRFENWWNKNIYITKYREKPRSIPGILKKYLRIVNGQIIIKNISCKKNIKDYNKIKEWLENE